VNGVETPDRDQQSNRASDQTKQSAFDQDKPHQAPAACAHRSAHGQFLASRKGARQLQIGHIGAGDEQDAADGDEKQVEILPVIADSRLEQSLCVNRAAGVRRGIFFR